MAGPRGEVEEVERPLWQQVCRHSDSHSHRVSVTTSTTTSSEVEEGGWFKKIVLGHLPEHMIRHMLARSVSEYMLKQVPKHMLRHVQA